MKFFDCILKNPNVLAEFVYVYKLGLLEVVLIKDMIHPKRSRSPGDGPTPLKVYCKFELVKYHILTPWIYIGTVGEGVSS